eukprot:5725617-Pyramimonas_sp.AAC.1
MHIHHPPDPEGRAGGGHQGHRGPSRAVLAHYRGPPVGAQAVPERLAHAARQNAGPGAQQEVEPGKGPHGRSRCAAAGAGLEPMAAG